MHRRKNEEASPLLFYFHPLIDESPNDVSWNERKIVHHYLILGSENILGKETFLLLLHIMHDYWIIYYYNRSIFYIAGKTE